MTRENSSIHSTFHSAQETCDRLEARLHAKLLLQPVVGIRSYRNCATKRFAGGDRRRLSSRMHLKIAKILERLEVIRSPADLRKAGYKYHRLKGDRKGAYAVEISRAWRVVFRFRNGNAFDVELVDYHPS